MYISVKLQKQALEADILMYNIVEICLPVCRYRQFFFRYTKCIGILDMPNIADSMIARIACGVHVSSFCIIIKLVYPHCYL